MDISHKNTMDDRSLKAVLAQYTLRHPVALVDELRNLAFANGRSVNREVEMAVRAWVERSRGGADA